jgi:hypothetical protein
MSASASSPLASEEKQEAAPVRHYKGVNDLDKVVLHEVRGSCAEVPVFHSRELPGMFQLPDPDVNPRLLPWCCLKLDFSVAAPDLFPLLYCICMLQVFETFQMYVTIVSS